MLHGSPSPLTRPARRTLPPPLLLQAQAGRCRPHPRNILWHHLSHLYTWFGQYRRRHRTRSRRRGHPRRCRRHCLASAQAVAVVRSELWAQQADGVYRMLLAYNSILTKSVTLHFCVQGK